MRDTTLLLVILLWLWVGNMPATSAQDVPLCTADSLSRPAQPTSSALAATALQPPQAPCAECDTLRPPRHWDVKVNAVGVAMLVVNAAVEYHFRPQWSALLPLYYSGWDYFRHDRKFRCFVVQPEVRYYFSKADTTGWFAGIHGGVAYYNVASPSSRYRRQDKDGTHPAWNVGATAGFRHTLSPSHHLALEYHLGIGLFSGSFDRWYNTRNGLLHDTRRTTRFLIDQVGVSLVYQIPSRHP